MSNQFLLNFELFPIIILILIVFFYSNFVYDIFLDLIINKKNIKLDNYDNDLDNFKQLIYFIFINLNLSLIFALISKNSIWIHNLWINANLNNINFKFKYFLHLHKKVYEWDAVALYIFCIVIFFTILICLITINSYIFKLYILLSYFQILFFIFILILDNIIAFYFFLSLYSISFFFIMYIKYYLQKYGNFKYFNLNFFIFFIFFYIITDILLLILLYLLYSEFSLLNLTIIKNIILDFYKYYYIDIDNENKYNFFHKNFHKYSFHLYNSTIVWNSLFDYVVDYDHSIRWHNKCIIKYLNHEIFYPREIKLKYNTRFSFRYLLLLWIYWMLKGIFLSRIFSWILTNADDYDPKTHGLAVVIAIRESLLKNKFIRPDTDQEISQKRNFKKFKLQHKKTEDDIFIGFDLILFGLHLFSINLLLLWRFFDILNNQEFIPYLYYLNNFSIFIVCFILPHTIVNDKKIKNMSLGYILLTFTLFLYNFIITTNVGELIIQLAIYIFFFCINMIFFYFFLKKLNFTTKMKELFYYIFFLSFPTYLFLIWVMNFYEFVWVFELDNYYYTDYMYEDEMCFFYVIREVWAFFLILSIGIIKVFKINLLYKKLRKLKYGVGIFRLWGWYVHIFLFSSILIWFFSYWYVFDVNGRVEDFIEFIIIFFLKILKKESFWYKKIINFLDNYWYFENLKFIPTFLTIVLNYLVLLILIYIYICFFKKINNLNLKNKRRLLYIFFFIWFIYFLIWENYDDCFDEID